MPHLKKRLPPMANLITLEAAFRHGSFTRAANELNLSQASVSRQIRELEKSLGVPLFERRRYDVLPTDIGRVFCHQIIRSLKEIAEAADEVRTQTNERSFTVLSDLALANSMIAPLIGEFNRRYQDVHLRVLATSEPIEDVSEEFDLGLQSGRWATNLFEVIPVADDLVFPVCSPEFFRQLPKQCKPQDLVTVPLLYHVQIGRRWCTWTDFLREFNVSLPDTHNSLEFNSYELCLEVAARGEGIALAWSRSIQPKLESGQLLRIPGMSIPLPERICFYRRLGKQPHPLADQFIRFFSENVGELDAS